MQENYSDCSGVAKHALVLGSSDHVQSDPTEPAQPVDTTFQSDPSQKSDESKSPCMAPRATAIKEQGRFLKEDQPDQYMRQSRPFLQSGASLIGGLQGTPCKVSC